MTRVGFEVNGTPHTVDVEPRILLVDVLRDHLGLTGTHIGCEQGVCGTCTVQLDGKSVRSCLTLAVQADGASIRTVEGLAPSAGPLHPLQSAFHEHHALQCGYCTPGFLMSIEPVLPELRGLGEREIREELAGNLCRCTGYQNIVEATQATASGLAAGGAVVVEGAVPVEADGDGVWTEVVNPAPFLEGLGIARVETFAPNAWRGELLLGGGTVTGTLELLDLDDDRRVANFGLRGRESGGAGQVRGTLRVSLDGATLCGRAELEFIGSSVVVDREPMEARFGDALAVWARTVAEGTAQSAPGRPARAKRQRSSAAIWALAAVLTAWIAWRVRRSR